MKWFYSLIWKLFGDVLIHFYIKHHNKPVTHNNLEYAFTDTDGKKYYRYSNSVSLAYDRYGKMIEYLGYLSARITPQALKELTDKGLEIIQLGIDKNKGAAKVAAIMYQIQERQNWIIPHQLIYDVLAVQLIREDESPDKWDKEIHLQKVDRFMNETCKNSFFFQLPELKRLINSTTLSEKEWMDYCRESMEQQSQEKRLLTTYS